MSTDEPPKKRKVGDGGNGGTDDGTTTSLAAIWAEMKDMKVRLSRMDELESEGKVEAGKRGNFIFGIRLTLLTLQGRS